MQKKQQQQPNIKKSINDGINKEIHICTNRYDLCYES